MSLLKTDLVVPDRLKKRKEKTVAQHDLSSIISAGCQAAISCTPKL